MNNSDLFSIFPETSAKAWKQKIQVDLKGEDYNEKLVWESPEGIKIKPFYHSEDLETLDLTGLSKNTIWEIGQSIYGGNTIAANKKALNAIEMGAESILFTVPKEEIAPEELLRKIDLKKTTIHFNLQFLSINYVATILNLAGSESKNIFFNIDIIGNLARSGNWFQNLEADFKMLDAICALGHPTTLGIDLSLYENAGANRVQQLAYALAHANEYLNRLDKKNKEALKNTQLAYTTSIGSDYFFEIAKLRALRILSGTLSREYEADIHCHITAIPTKRNKTLYDYNTNLLRTTTECMSAVLGGADTVRNMPYDAIFHKENDFGTRMARNQLLLLKQESHFNKVGNAADGSYYIEVLTQQLAAKALELFKQIEAGGGFLTQLKHHLIQKKIKESAHKEQESFNMQKKILVGSNKYQMEGEHIKNNLELYPFVKTHARKTWIEPILEKRVSEELEQERIKRE